MKLRWVAIATACLIVACGDKRRGTQEPPPTPTPANVDDAQMPDGLAMRLSNGKQGAPAADRAKIAPATKLGDADVAKLLARTKPLEAEPADTQAFVVRPGSQPPPKAGSTIATAFPPAPSTLLPPTTTASELTVVRAVPEGAVPIVPQVSVTFSQPMVAVTSQEDAAKVVPVKLTPQPKGAWRWLGTRTIVFDPEVRMPQATTYTLEVPAGTKSATGGVMKAATKYTFTTPAPTIVSSWPTYGNQKLDVPIFVLFDQAIDPRAMLSRIRVTANQQTVATRLLDDNEIAADKEIEALVATAKADEHDGRWLVFRAVSPLPADAQISVDVERGAPSKEGPGTTTDPQSFSFRTYPPLRLTKATCGWSDQDECRPMTPLRIELSNVLDAEKFDAKSVTVEPATPGLQITTASDSIMIYGAKKANTKYTITVAPSLRDMFDQTLPAAVSSSFFVGPDVPTFFGPDGMIVLDPMAEKPTLDVFTTAHAGLAVKLSRSRPRITPAIARGSILATEAGRSPRHRRGQKFSTRRCRSRRRRRRTPRRRSICRRR